MVRPGLRSRSKIRKTKRTPGGELKRHYVSKTKLKSAKCIKCGKTIGGSSLTASAKTQKRPNRKFPNLCTKCSRAKVKESARNM